MLATSPIRTASACGSARRASAARASLRACSVTRWPHFARSLPAMRPRPSDEPVMNTRAIVAPLSGRALALLGRKRQRQPLGPAQYVERGAAADLITGQRADQIVGTGDLLAIKRHDNIAATQAGARGRAVRFDRTGHHRAFLIEARRMAQPRRQHDLLRGDADKGAAYAAVAHQFAE